MGIYKVTNMGINSGGKIRPSLCRFLRGHLCYGVFLGANMYNKHVLGVIAMGVALNG